MKTLIKHAEIIADESQHFIGNVLLENGKIKEVSCDEILVDETVECFDGTGKLLLPGLIDIHLHGSYGYDFIRNPQEAVDIVSKGLIKEGTTSFLASLTVVDHKTCCDLLTQYHHVQNQKGSAHFLGVHSEGPYLSKEYKALMDERWLRDPDKQEVMDMLQSAKGILKVMTFAPERQGSEWLIDTMIKNNVTMMIGHTACTSKQAYDALQKGVWGFTHLYNAMTQHSHRSPGAVTAALLHDRAYAELIVDRFHTHPDVVASTIKHLGSKRIILITDAMLGKGMPDGDYVFSNLNCHKTGNTVQVIETGRIAGSAITMLDALKNTKKLCNCSYNELVEMACINPAKAINLYPQKGTIHKNADADLILLDHDLNLFATFIDGKCCYTSK